MFYYRYRPFSELSLKELLYSELYFTSAEECNDPFDSKAFYQFPDDEESWKSLFETSAKQLQIQIPSELLKNAINVICQKCPIMYEDILNSNVFSGIPLNSHQEKDLLSRLFNHVRNILRIHSPDHGYFVSFSKLNNEPLMWSHYADKHNGICLIFKSIDECIRQDNRLKKDVIYGIALDEYRIGIGSSMPENFPLVDIKYEEETKPLNAFTRLLEYVTPFNLTEENQKDILKERQSHYSQKHINWSYEKESRIILPPPFSQLNGGQVKYSKQDRLFHYEPSQLVGIIFGARMSTENRKRIVEIIEERNRWAKPNVNYKRTFFDFVIFDAKLSINQRTIGVTPSSIISYETFRPGDPEFYPRFEMWNNGVGREVINGIGEKVIVP